MKFFFVALRLASRLDRLWCLGSSPKRFRQICSTRLLCGFCLFVEKLVIDTSGNFLLCVKFFHEMSLNAFSVDGWFLQHIVATHSHSLAVSKPHLDLFPRNAKRNPHNFSRVRCSYGSHEPSTMDLISFTLYLSLSSSLSLSIPCSLAPSLSFSFSVIAVIPKLSLKKSACPMSYVI